jgi:type II secretory pathway predicted ATPase ExeA
MKNSEQDFTLPPFPGFPSTNRYVALGPVMETVSRVARSILAREAISLVIGPPGTGKSLTCALLAKQFAESHDIVAIGETSIMDESSFHRIVLHRLGVALETGKRDDLELMVYERLAGEGANANGVVLIIDEAASLSTDVLEAIRRMTNIMRDGQPMASAVVAGGVKLDETLAAPAMEAFSQRVAARCYLHPLNAEEARQYIRQSIRRCDASPDETITDTALSAIYHASSGIPRLINQLMTEAIDCAAEMDEMLISDHTVDKAWACLQQLPSPMVEEPVMNHESSDIEFGELTDLAPMPQCEESVDPIRSELIANSICLDELQGDMTLESPLEDRIDFENDPSSPDAVIALDEATDPVSLFGEFEDEEKIEVGAAVQPIAHVPTEVDLESMLHSEIVGLSQFASENTASRYAQPEIMLFEEDSNAENVESDQDAENLRDSGNEYPSVVWYDEPDHGQAAEGDELASPKDDTDLLWITEDIDIDRRTINPATKILPHRVDQPDSKDAPKLSVDYREMLEKMRNQA